MKKIAFILVMTLAFPLLMPQASMMAANDGATASNRRNIYDIYPNY